MTQLFSLQLLYKLFPIYFVQGFQKLKNMRTNHMVKKLKHFHSFTRLFPSVSHTLYAKKFNTQIHENNHMAKNF